MFDNLNSKVGTAADLLAFAGRVAVVAEALIEWIKMILVLLSSHLLAPNHDNPFSYFRSSTFRLSEFRRSYRSSTYTKIWRQKKEKDERSSYYDSALLRKEVLWLLSCKTKSNLVSPVVVKSCLPQARTKSPFDYVG